MECLIKTKRLKIYEASDKDVDMIIEIEAHPENRDFLWVGTPEEHRDEIMDPNHLLLLFEDTDTETEWDPIADGYPSVPRSIKGYALVRLNFKSNIFEIRRIAITEKGKGYGRESMEGLVKYAFEETETNRLWLDVYPDNISGINLYESLGMHKDGVLRQNYKAERGYLDQIIYSMLRSEYER
ncbi:MAG: GNAT family N-acetyltransferase [Firmicutes bacterium]|nr:GNAT family N-acetyltransferase [Bacillota bacterium]